jgi:hypothetical protein
MSITSPLAYNRGCDNLAEVDTPHWRDRLRVEEKLLEQLELQAEAARKRRAQALRDGVSELGSVYAVAKDLSRSWTAVDNALKKYTTE